MMTSVEKPAGPAEFPEMPEPMSEEAKYLDWVAQKVRNDDFWMRVKEDIIENFANLLNRELPAELWNAAYSQRDGRDYLIAFEAVVERLQDYCARIEKRR